MRRSPTPMTLAAVVAALAVPASAVANDYGPPSIASVAPAVQFDLADSSVVSGNGQFLVFRGTVSGQTGLWRRNLQSGQLDQVAVNLPGASQNLDPQAPSVSADGRYVAFDTQVPLDPVNDTNATWDVYVRDMTIPAGQPGAYVLASAVNGGTAALTYGSNTTQDGAHLAGWQFPRPGGALAGPGGTITADGRTVVFSVDTTSNLATPTSTTTPARQVAVRNLDTDTTTLVSTDHSGRPVAFGAVRSDDAVISADGTTVAWISPFGAIQQESTTLNGEQTLYGVDPDPTLDIQAVWKRIAAGPTSPTYRITGPVDPLAASCPSGATVNGFNIPSGCAGPLDTRADASAFSHLALTADGYHVVLLSQAALVGSNHNHFQDAYLIDMHPGLTRIQATRALTQASATASGEASIVGTAISGDGSTVVLSSPRTHFDLASPSFIGAARASAATGDELYEVNLKRDTVDLVTQGYDGSFANYGFTCNNGSGSYSPSLSASGSVLGFDSCATNLVFGDGNAASDVFWASASGGVSSVAPPQTVAGLPALPSPGAGALHVTASRRSDGTLMINALTPEAGRLGAVATSRVPTSRTRRRGRTIVHYGTRTVARRTTTVRTPELATLPIALGSSYRTLATAPDSLSTSVTVTLVTVTGRRLVVTVHTAFSLPRPRRRAVRHAAHRPPARPRTNGRRR